MWVRPLLPIDETRYLTVAWEMWSGGNYLVPQLNGEPYHHKPPLLFWLINGVWLLTGVNDVAARLISPLFGYGIIVITWGCARNLWPRDANAQVLAPCIVVGTLLWAVMTTLTMFDTILTFFSLLALMGVLFSYRAINPDNSFNTNLFIRGCLLFGVALGLGILSKGPVIIVFTLPIVLLGPIWVQTKFLNRKLTLIWYCGFFLALLLGVVIALCWALPASQAGGEDFSNAILWGQTAHRVLSGISHERAWWWYGVFIPLIFFPWFFWPETWKLLLRVNWRNNCGIRFCLLLLVSAILILTLFAEKQPHYLLPIVPIFSLLLARLLSQKTTLSHRSLSNWFPTVFFLFIGIILFFVAFVDNFFFLDLVTITVWDKFRIIFSALVIIFICIVGLLWRSQVPSSAVVFLSIQSVVLIILLHISVLPVMKPLYDIKKFSEQVAILVESKRNVVHIGKYHGQFHYLGQINKPIEVIHSNQLSLWLEKNPTGVLIYKHRNYADVIGKKPIYQQPFRSRVLAIWSSEDARKNLEMFTR